MEAVRKNIFDLKSEQMDLLKTIYEAHGEMSDEVMEALIENDLKLHNKVDSYAYILKTAIPNQIAELKEEKAEIDTAIKALTRDKERIQKNLYILADEEDGEKKIWEGDKFRLKPYESIRNDVDHTKIPRQSVKVQFSLFGDVADALLKFLENQVDLLGMETVEGRLLQRAFVSMSGSADFKYPTITELKNLDPNHPAIIEAERVPRIRVTKQTKKK